MGESAPPCSRNRRRRIRVLLLGDVVEPRGLPLGVALERARPFFAELGGSVITR